MLQLSGDGIFYTIQGEGPTLGHPAVFMRLLHCNLSCVWCDAWYTWDKTKPEFHTERSTVSLQEAEDRIRSYNCNRLVITGGEPLIQHKQLSLLVERLKGFAIEIETNGTLVPPTGLQGCQFNVSPKLGNSGCEGRTIPKALTALNKLNSTFKFVVASAADVEEVMEFTPMIDLGRIILMPLGTDTPTIQQHLRAIVEPAKVYGLRITPRLQVDIWGDRRGV